MSSPTQETKKVFSLTLNSKIADDKKLMDYLRDKRITDTLKQALHLMIEQEEKGKQEEPSLQDLEGKVVLSENQFDKLIDAVTVVTNLMNSATLGVAKATETVPNAEPQLSEEERQKVEAGAKKVKNNFRKRTKEDEPTSE